LIWRLTWLRMSGDVPPLPHTPLRHSHGQHLTFIRHWFVFMYYLFVIAGCRCAEFSH